VTWDSLLGFAQDSPLLLAVLVGAGGVLATVERVFALTGPITKVAHWWQGRELARLKREALLRAERRRIQDEERSHREAVLTEENAWLREQLRRARAGSYDPEPDTSPARNRARPQVPRR
jgi:hypothetical protein